jgi:hypothetical protein
MNVNDFLISLGFDTNKLNKQIEDVQKKFEKIAVGVGVKSPAAERAKRKELSDAEKLEKTKARLKSQLAERERTKQAKAELGIVDKVAKAKAKVVTERVKAKADNSHVIAYQKSQKALETLHAKALIANEKFDAQQNKSSTVRNKLSDEQLVQRAIEARQKQEISREIQLHKLQSARARERQSAELAARRGMSAEEEWMFRRRKAVEQLVSKESNPQLKALNNYYRNLQSNDTEIGNRSEMIKRRRNIGQLRNSQAFKDLSQDYGKAGRTAAAEFLIQGRKLLNEGKIEAFRGLKADVQKQVRDLRKGVSTNIGMQRYDASALAQQSVGAARGRGLDAGIANAFGSRIAGSESIQQAKQYSNILGMISTRLNALDRYKKAELLRIVESGDIARLVDFNRELGRTSNEMRRAERRAISLRTMQNGLADSTRNLVREYASLYAVFAGVYAIKEQAKAMDGVEAGMTAVSKSAEEVAHNIKFIKDEALKNGLAIGEAAKSYVKLKAAIGDKKTLQETEQMFQALTKAGVVFQLSQDDMTGVIKAVSQSFAKGKLQAEELRSQLNLAA